MQHHPYHIHRRRISAARGDSEPGPSRRPAFSGLVRAMAWLLMIAGVVVWLAAGTRPQTLVAVVDLVLLFAAGSMLLCLAALLLMNLSDRRSAPRPPPAAP